MLGLVGVACCYLCLCLLRHLRERSAMAVRDVYLDAVRLDGDEAAERVSW